jgi:undecaprenyl-diphosphatase
MDIITQLIAIDKQIFLLINSLHSAYFDAFMYTISKVPVWIPFYISVVYVLLKTYRKKGLWIVLVLILSVVMSDQISVFIKETVQRLRPSHDESLANFIHLVNNRKAGLYGFVSSHATNTVGFALLSSLIIRNKLYSISVLLWASIVCYSRIYLGVHFPLDIIGGALLGTTIAVFLYSVYSQTFLKKYKHLEIENPKIPIITLSIIGLSILIFSFLDK